MSDLSTIAGPRAPLDRSPRELRDDLERMIRLDLLGPAGGEYEELDEQPSERYLLGMLAPREHPSLDPVPDEELGVGDVSGDSGEEGEPEPAAPAVDQLVPSAFGMTFVLDEGCKQLEVVASWGHYTRGKSEYLRTATGQPKSVWQRRPAGGRIITIEVPSEGMIGPLTPDEEQPEVIVRGRARTHGDRRIVTVFLVNEQDERERGGDAAWLFQSELCVRAPGRAPVFVRRPLASSGSVPEVDRTELASLDMLYRHEGELAVGHGVATHAVHADRDNTRAVELATTAMPAAEVPLTEAPGVEDFAGTPEARVPQLI